MKPSEASKLVLMLFKSFPNARTDEDNARAFESALIDLDAIMAGKAIERLRATRTFLPSIAEIRQATIDLQLGPLTTGEQAYATMLGVIRKVGAYATPRFTDPLITQAIGVWGSWQDVCRSPENDAAGRARFIELYDQLARRRREAQVSGIPLPSSPTPTREFTLPKPKLLPPHDAPRDEPPLPPIVSKVTVTPARERPPDAPYRKLSAEDIERELAERDRKKAGGQ